MAEALLIEPVVGVVVETAIQKFVSHIRYCINYKKNVETLVSKVKDLKDTKADLQRKVTAATKNLDPIQKVVETWFERVEKEVEHDEMMAALMSFANGEDAEIFRHDLCCNGWCSCRRQHKIGRQAQQKIDIINELVNQGKSFVQVSDSCSTLTAEIINTPADTGNIVYFASRELTRNQVAAALKDERTFSVGIYGMGGVGKTTLKDQVHKQVIEEKLFDVVVTTVVSQNVDLKKIQDDIAKGLQFKKLKDIDDKAKRAALLKGRLKQEKSILVILDDVWATEVDLFAVIGIPFGEYSGGGCKVLITTRNRQVCNSLLIQSCIEVGLLSDEESWHLFKKNAGDVVDSPELQKIAREVVNECCRLPLALDTLARALRNNKDKQVWEYIASQLRNSNYAEIEGMGPRVYSSIRFSYDFARNFIIKRCFLLCCLFPEDEEICAKDLLIYAMGDDVIRGDLETLMQVRARLHAALYKLVSLGLLIRVNQSAVKMHDIVRDVAISIASEDGNHFYVKAGLGLKDWPHRGLSAGKCLRLSLIGNDIHHLPTQPQLPHLLSLSLRDNDSLENIPDNFFESMNQLSTLDINSTSISSLPLSITCLANLRSLDMGDCDFHGQQHRLGKLKKLEILNLARCGLSSLPEEIGGLSHLKWLDLSGNGGLNIPPNVISRLTCLENLSTILSFEWRVGEARDENRNAANLDELVSLTCLMDVELTATWDAGSEVSMFKTHSGSFTRIDSPDEVSRVSESPFCSLHASPPYYNSVKMLVAKAESLLLDDCADLKSMGELVTSSDGLGFDNLKCLTVIKCKEMEYLLNVTKMEIPKAVFNALEVLEFKWMDSLKEILHGPMPPVESLMANLKSLNLFNCKKLVGIFSLDVFLKLQNLEELEVSCCDGLKEVFPLEEEGDHITLLPQLRQLVLAGVGITNIWNGKFNPIHSLGNLKAMEVTSCPELRFLFTPAIVIALQQLEKLHIRFCKNLVAIVAPEDESMLVEDNHIPDIISLPSQRFFPNLKILNVLSCDSLKVLYPPSRKLSCRGGLSRLLQVTVAACESLEEILAFDMAEECEDNGGGGEDHLEKTNMPQPDQLEMLFLKELPSLKTIWKGTILMESFKNITKAMIGSCDGIKLLIPVRVLRKGGLSQLRELGVQDCKDLEEIIGIDDTNVDDQQKCFTSYGSLENLRTILIENCNSLKHVFPMRLLAGGGLHKLEIVMVRNCARLEVMCYEDGGSTDKTDTSRVVHEVFPELMKLYLIRLPTLSSFYQQGDTPLYFGFPSLVSLFVVDCNLKRLPFTFSHQNIPPNLKKIMGDSEETFDKLLELEEESIKSSLRPLFKVYEKDAEIDDLEENS